MPLRQGGDGAVWRTAVGPCGVRLEGTEGVTTESAEDAEERQGAAEPKERGG